MSVDKYYQRAEYIVGKGYLPKMDISKLADMLRQREAANVQSTVFINTRDTVYGQWAEEIGKRVEAMPPEKKQLLGEMERTSAISNGNIANAQPVVTTVGATSNT